MIKRPIKITSAYSLLIGIVIILLTACGAGGGETGTGQTTATTPTSVTVGVITGFGSVFVNGIEFNTNSTVISVNNVESSETNLKVGMIVTLTGSIDKNGVTGLASSIFFNSNVEGMVLSNTVAIDSQLNILGQTIIIDEFDTIFDSEIPSIKTIAEIQANNIVEISGHTAGNGTIYATRVTLKKLSRAQNDEIKLEGFISNITPTDFIIGDLTIDFSTAKFIGIESENLQENDFIEVRSVNDLNPLSEFIALEVRIKEKNQTIFKQDHKALELEGIITGIDNNTIFRLNGQAITIDDTTIFRNENAFSVGKKVKISGVIDENKNIIASIIEVKNEEKAQVEGLISAIDYPNKSITVQGVEIVINNFTTLKDDRDNIESAQQRSFNFDKLRVDNNVTVSYFFDNTSGRYIANKLELEDPEDESPQEKEDEDD